MAIQPVFPGVSVPCFAGPGPRSPVIIGLFKRGTWKARKRGLMEDLMAFVPVMVLVL